MQGAKKKKKKEAKEVVTTLRRRRRSEVSFRKKHQLMQTWKLPEQKMGFSAKS